LVSSLFFDYFAKKAQHTDDTGKQDFHGSEKNEILIEFSSALIFGSREYPRSLFYKF